MSAFTSLPWRVPVFRLRLRQLIEDALSVHLCDANDYFNFYYQLERMVEAAYLIYERENEERKRGEQTKT